MLNIPLDLLLGFGIGLSLGLLGGGGSILTVPALVYLVGQPPQAAINTSLAIVGINSLLGAMFHRSDGSLNWRVALLFGSAGMLASYLAAHWVQNLAPALLMTLFAILMLLVSRMMWSHQKAPRIRSQITSHFWVVPLTGLGVGIITGLLGVGGGFLIVPALVMLIGLPIYEAVGTSLLIIAANSFAGLIGHLNSGYTDLALTLVFVAAGLVGIFIGTRLAGRIPAAILRRSFAGFVLCLAIFLLWDNLPKLLL